MIKRKFLESDPLLQRVRSAHGAVHALSVELHYLSCDSGVGRPERKRKPSTHGTSKRIVLPTETMVRSIDRTADHA
jgi:hypothetical protein